MTATPTAPDAGAVVRRLFDAVQARDWQAAAGCLAPDVVVTWTATGERFEGDAYLGVQIAYPEGWAITGCDVVADGERVAADVRVEQDGVTYWCGGFYTVRDGVVAEGVEHWVTEGGEQPPAWRQPFDAAR